MSELIYKGSVVNLSIENVELPNGNEVKLELITHPGAAAVLPVFDTGEVILIKQYRYAAGGFIFEVPAGKLDKGEEPVKCAKRETEEETGYLPGKLHFMTTIHTTPGFTDEKIHLYCATDLTKTMQNLGSDEVLSTIIVPFKEAMQMVYDRKITDAKTIITILLAQKLLGELQIL